MSIKFYDSNGKYWGEYDETRSLFIPSEEVLADRKTEPTAYADGYADGQRDERERWERMADRKTENSSEKPNNSKEWSE